ncbi:fatty acid synthase alpha subunit Lsd1, partial [Kickxella alabastrina]
EEFAAAQHAQSQLVKRSIGAMATFLGITTDRDVGGNNDSSRLQAELLADLDTYSSELGAAFCEGIRPVFSAAMARHYDSWWNWARQDLVELFFDILCGKVSHSDIHSAPRCLRLANRLSPLLMDSLRYIVHCAQQGSSPGHKLAHKYGSSLIRVVADMCADDSAFAPPAYQFTAMLMAPRLRIGSPGGTFGSIEYTEILRPSEKSIADFVDAVTSTLMYALAAMRPVWADLAGRFQHHPHAIRATNELRAALAEMSAIVSAVSADSLADFKDASVFTGESGDIERVYRMRTTETLANHQFKLPCVKEYAQLKHLHHLQGMINLDRVVVITGYGEVGPHGNAETRWQMEAFGD